MRSWLSMFCKFWEFTGRGNLKILLPIIENNISKWEKDHTQVTAKPFESSDISNN